MFKRFKRGSESDKLYNAAMEKYMSLRYQREGTTEFRSLLLDILDLCQKAIYLNDRAGDAHVLLANAYLLIFFETAKDVENSLLLKLGGAVIQHWSDEPMQKYPWTKNRDNGWHVFEGILSGIGTLESVTSSRAKILMSNYKLKYLKDALSPGAIDMCSTIFKQLKITFP